MIIFDPKKLNVVPINIKSVSSSMGGVLTIVDDNDTIVKHSISSTLARQFIKYYGLSNFWTPKKGFMLTYESVILAIELSTPGLGYSNIDINTQRIIDLINDGSIWYFDGSFIYTNTSDFQSLGYNNFFVQPTNSIPLNAIGFELGIHQETRYCVGYQVPNMTVISPPIWKSFNSYHNIEKEVGLPNNFDEFNDKYYINLNFAIYAGKQLVNVFPYDVIDPLLLPELIIELQCINLDALPSEIKWITPIHMEFKHAFAWLLGLQARTTNISELIVVRSVMRYLVSNCCVAKDEEIGSLPINVS